MLTRADDGNKRALNGPLIITVVLTCFGSSMLYGYSLAVVNLPGSHITCYLDRSVLGGNCEDPKPRNVSNCLPNLTMSDSCGVEDRTDLNFSTIVPRMNASPLISIFTGHLLYSISNAIFVIGGAIGAFSTGTLADFFGRRNGLLFNHIFAILGAAMVLSNLWVQLPLIFFVSRFIVGVNCGITIGLASIYLTEISPRHLRGAIGACHQLAVTLGIVVAYITTLKITFNSARLWPIALSLSGVPAIISLILLPILSPESPRYLYLKRNDVEGARQAFSIINHVEDVEVFIGELRAEVEFTQNQPAFRFKQLFTQRDLRMPLLLACLVQIMQQLSGINAVITYSSLMFTSAGISVSYKEICVVAIGVLNVVCTVISLPLLERFGRRTLLLWPSALLALSLVVLTVSVNLADPERHWTVGTTQKVMAGVSVLFILTYMVGFAFGLGPIPGLIVAELFRQGPRGAAYSVSQFLQWMSNLLVMATFPVVNKFVGGFSFLPFLVTVVVCWIYLYNYMPETSGRTFDEIARDLAFGVKRREEHITTFAPEDIAMEEKGSIANTRKDEKTVPLTDVREPLLQLHHVASSSSSNHVENSIKV